MLILLTSCKKEEKVVLKEDFIFGYAGPLNLKMFKFKGDTFFVSHSYPSRIKGYFYLINDNEKVKINEYLDSIKINDYKREYINDNVIDGLYYQFEFLKSEKLVYVQNFESEQIKTLNTFAEYLIKLSSRKKEIEHFNLKIDFGNLERILDPPEPAYDSLN